MAGENPTQKEIARRYNGNLGYFREPHYLRRLRAWSFIVTVVASLVAVATFGHWGKDEIFSKGPLSRAHARFADSCDVCHTDAETDLLKAMLGTRPSNGSLTAIFATAPHQGGGKANAPSVDANPAALRARTSMDRACLKCHTASALHLPQAAGLALRNVSTELALVHATNCYVCHREHAGHERMPLPSRETCASCHNDAGRLSQARASLASDGATIASTGENRDLGDGVIRFISPPRPPGTLKPFPDYASGHPPFAYEQPGLRDPADLRFNHARHAREDIPKLENRKMDCTDCHKPRPGGVFYQPVSYEQHCKRCHSLQIQPTLPNLLVPHGNSEKVRYFLASLETSVDHAVRAEGITDPGEIASRVASEMQRLRDRGLGVKQIASLEQRVFFEGEPRNVGNDPFARTDVRKFLTECAKCHTVDPATVNSPPQVHRPAIAGRWVQRGPFTHLPHQHMDCRDCHKAAETSKLTSDILMPAQELCAECHRPPGSKNLRAAQTSLKSQAAAKADKTGKAQFERETGGIKWDCQSCHTFHSPSNATHPTQAQPANPHLPSIPAPGFRDQPVRPR